MGSNPIAASIYFRLSARASRHSAAHRTPLDAVGGLAHVEHRVRRVLPILESLSAHNQDIHGNRRHGQGIRRKTMLHFGLHRCIRPSTVAAAWTWGQKSRMSPFLAANLYAPFYVVWEGILGEIFQLHNFRPPRRIATFDLSTMDSGLFDNLRITLSPSSVIEFCRANEIKKFDVDEKVLKIEGEYVGKLREGLGTFKILDLPRPIDLAECYVPLYVQESQLRAPQTEQTEKAVAQGLFARDIEAIMTPTREAVTMEEVLDRFSQVVVIGVPGGGKTTLLKHLCLLHCHPDSIRLPVFVPIRELAATGETLNSAILRQIRRYSGCEYPDAIWEKALGEGRVLICIDGLDELDIQKPEKARHTLRQISAEIRDLTARHAANLIVVSVRRESWPTCRAEVSPTFHEFEVLPFTRSNVRELVLKN